MRRRQVLLAALAGGVAAASGCTTDSDGTSTGAPSTGPTSALPDAATGPATGRTSLADVLAARRSLREFSGDPLTEDEVGHLCWAAQGVSSPDGLRTAPSAGALYPLTLSVALPDGLHRYVPDGHALRTVAARDLRAALAEAALGQDWVGTAPAVFAISGDISRTASKYGDRAERYVHLEAGHAAENLLLRAVSLGLGATPVGAFDDDRVRRLLVLPDRDQPTHLLPVGRPPG